MPSTRMQWNAVPNPLTKMLEEKRRRGVRILDLTESNPTRAGLEYPRAEILAALAQPGVLEYRADPRGHESARAAVAATAGVGPESVLLTASTSEAYALLFKMLCDPGDVVLAPQPSYPLFDHLAALEGVKLHAYGLRPDREWTVNLSGVPGGARAILAVSPNNPTGSYLSSSDLDQISKLGIPLICDEVFADYPLGPAPEPARHRTDMPVFTLGGLSKSAGLPQIKLGWIIATGPGAPEALDRLAAVADAYLSVSATAMAAAPALLRLAPTIRASIAARTRANLDFLRAGAGKRLSDPQGGWYAVLEASSERTDEEWALAFLERDDVLVHPGYFYNFPREGYLVTSLLPPVEVFREGAAKVLARI